MESGGTVDYSVVVPIKDEEESLPHLVRRIQAVLRDENYEIVLVDDGSTDQSLSLIRDLSRNDHTVRYLSLDRNYGKSTALAAGFDKAEGKIIVTLDGDLQNVPEDIPLLLDCLSECDLVVGQRVDRKDSLIRRLSSRIANTVRNWATNDGIADAGCGLSAFHKSCLSRVRLYKGADRFLATLFIIEGLRVKQIPVSHHRRIYGHSKYGVWNRLWCGLMDLLALRWMISRDLKYGVREEK